MTKQPEILSLREAGLHAHVQRQSIYLAIKKGRLKATKVNNRWRIKLLDLDDYRCSKYNRDYRTINGELVFDMEKGEFSVQQVCKVMCATLNRQFSMQRLYYLLRIGQVKAFKKGSTWVILKEDAVALLDIELTKNQMAVG